MEQPTHRPWWRTAYWIAFAGFATVAGFFLVTEHAAHLFGALPFLLLAACPLMHFFGHGHGGHSAGGGASTSGEERGNEPHRH